MIGSYRAEKAITCDLLLQHQYLLLELDNVAATAPNWSQDDVEYYVLMDDWNNLTALYRYCVAVKTQHDDVAAEFLNGAVDWKPFKAEELAMSEKNRSVKPPKHSRDSWPEEAFMELLQKLLEDRMMLEARAALSRPQVPMSLASMFTEMTDRQP